MKKTIAFIISLIIVILAVGCAATPTETIGVSLTDNTIGTQAETVETTLESLVDETTGTQATTLGSTEAHDDPAESVKSHYKDFVRSELEEAARIDGEKNVDVEYGVQCADIDLFGFFSGHAVALTTNIRYDCYAYEDVGKYRFFYSFVNYSYRIRVETQTEDGSYVFLSITDAFDKKLITDSDLDEIYMIYTREYSH